MTTEPDKVLGLMNQSSSCSAFWIKPLENLSFVDLLTVFFIFEINCFVHQLYLDSSEPYSLKSPLLTILLLIIELLTNIIIPISYAYNTSNADASLEYLIILEMQYFCLNFLLSLFLMKWVVVTLLRFTTGLAATMLLWPTIQEQIHQARNIHKNLNTDCPTAKAGLLGGGAFLSLDSSLFWLVALMLADNAREDYLDETGKEGVVEQGQVFLDDYDSRQPAKGSV